MLYSAVEISKICPWDIPIDEPLWTEKHELDELRVIEQGDKYTFAAQYQQNPSPALDGMFKDKYWKYYDVVPADISVMRIYGDTAQKKEEHNDYSVFQLWAKVPNQGIYLIDQVRGKWEAPELEATLLSFWNKHKPEPTKVIGAQSIKIEDKSSGSSLIQSIQREHMIPIEGIQRNRDKVFRAMGVVKYFEGGYLHIPANADWVHDYKEEFRKFTPTMTHRYDDQIDPTMDAVEDLIVFEHSIYTEAML